jgi:hypothetical protein
MRHALVMKQGSPRPMAWVLHATGNPRQGGAAGVAAGAPVNWRAKDAYFFRWEHPRNPYQAGLDMDFPC